MREFTASWHAAKLSAFLPHLPGPAARYRQDSTSRDQPRARSWGRSLVAGDFTLWLLAWQTSRSKRGLNEAKLPHSWVNEVPQPKPSSQRKGAFRGKWLAPFTSWYLSANDENLRAAPVRWWLHIIRPFVQTRTEVKPGVPCRKLRPGAEPQAIASHGGRDEWKTERTHFSLKGFCYHGGLANLFHCASHYFYCSHLTSFNSSPY